MPQSRSPSPYRREHAHNKHRSSRHTRSRSRSPRKNDDSHRHKRHRSRSPPRPVKLPYKAQPLSKRQYDEYKPLFQSYLDIQKQLNLDDLKEREVRGRWKSFVSRWNAGDLARSWYDPSMLKTAQETVASFRPRSPLPTKGRASPEYTNDAKETNGGKDESESDDDGFGPAPPPKNVGGKRSGPAIPRMDDLVLRDEMREEDRAQDRSNYRDDIRYERKQDRKAQKERLEELVPRAEPGSRERQLEKKRETTGLMRGFKDAKEGGEVEIGEADLMGDDDMDAYKKRKMEGERKKTEKEIRKEEVLRARAAEREEKLAERRQKENQTMEHFRALAKERFG